jgi:hypothetical protein
VIHRSITFCLAFTRVDSIGSGSSIETLPLSSLRTRWSFFEVVRFFFMAVVPFLVDETPSYHRRGTKEPPPSQLTDSAISGTFPA